MNFYDYDPTFQVEDHEVECDPRFRLFLHTTVEPHMVPPHLAAYSSVIYFQRSRADIEETLLDRFIYQEKSKLEEERVSLLQVKIQGEHSSTAKNMAAICLLVMAAIFLIGDYFKLSKNVL